MDDGDLGGWSGRKKGGDEIGGGLDGGSGERLDFDGGVGENLNFDGGDLGGLSGIKNGGDEIGGGLSGGKKGGDEIGGGLDGGGVERLDFDGGLGENLNFDGERLNFDAEGGEKLDLDGEGGERLDFDSEMLDFNGGGREILDFNVGFGENWDFDSGKLDFDGGGRERLDFDDGVRERLDFDVLNSGGLNGKKMGVDEIGGALDGGVYGRLDFGAGVFEKLDFDVSNSGVLSGRKRGADEIGGDLDVGISEGLDFDGGLRGKRRVGVFDRIEGGLGACQGVVEEGNEVANLFWGDSNMRRNEVDGVMGSEKVGERSSGLEGEKGMSFDLNISVSDGVEFVGRSLGVGVDARVSNVIDKEIMEVINISSDEEEDLVVLGVYKGKGKIIENEASFGSNSGLDLKKINEVDQIASGSMGGGSRYTREEKGKAKDVQPWMPLAGDPIDFELLHALDNFNIPEYDQQPPEIFQQNEVEVGVGELDYLNQQQDIELGLQREQEDREPELRMEQNAGEIELNEHLARIAEELRQQRLEERKRVHRRFARPLEEDGYRVSSDNDQNILLSARNMQREHKLKRRDQPLIRWKPSENHENNIAKRFVPSLLDLSLNVLANHADMIMSLEGVPNTLNKKLCNLVCDSRKMNVRILDLFIRDSPEEIRIKDASWITKDQFKKSFGSFDPKNLKVFQFDLGGHCISDDIIAETLARSLSSLPSLGIISLRGACRLSDEALKFLVKLAPGLCSMNLGECSLLTHVGINYIADALGNSLRELFIDYCIMIDAKDVAPALKKFKHLEVLSVAGIPNLCDGVISDIITACGRNIKDLDLENCQRLTDSSLKIIGQTCLDLHALNIFNVHNVTDVGLSYLANGCQSIRSLKLGRNELSDEAIAEFIELAGRSLEELSLNHVSQVGPFTALSLAKFSQKLLSLDLSWCRKITDEALGLIVDSCWSLKLLKLFGCTQITNVFLHGHSNSLVRIIGLDMTSLLERMGTLKTEEIYLRYSPLPVPCESENLDQSDV